MKIETNNLELDLKESTYVIDVEDSQDITSRLIVSDDLPRDIDIRINFKKGGISNRISIRTVLLAESHVTLNLLAIIPKSCKKVDTFIELRALLINENSSVNIVPSMEIHENDVKAGHGATVSYLDANALHYLNIHGLDTVESERLLIDSFLAL